MQSAYEFEQLYNFTDEYGMKELCLGIQEMFPNRNIPFEETVNALICGDFKGAFSLLFHGEMSYIIANIDGYKRLFIWIMILGILAALLSRFAEIFNKNQVADLSFYMVYLCMVSLLFESYSKLYELAGDTMQNIITFIRVLIPTYLLSVGIATGTVTATADYQLMVLLLYGVQEILINLLLPLVSAYMLLSVLNGVWIEEKLTLLIEFLEKCIEWILKASLGLVSGISFFQAALTPVIDSAKTSLLQKTVSALPGVGNGIESVMDLFIGSAQVIKNSVGIALLMFLILLCFSPLVQLFVVAFIMKGAAALMGIISDKRLTSCVNISGEAGMLLFKTTATAMLLFVISLALVSLSVKRF